MNRVEQLLREIERCASELGTAIFKMDPNSVVEMFPASGKLSLMSPEQHTFELRRLRISESRHVAAEGRNPDGSIASLRSGPAVTLVLGVSWPES